MAFLAAPAIADIPAPQGLHFHVHDPALFARNKKNRQGVGLTSSGCLVRA